MNESQSTIEEHGTDCMCVFCAPQEREDFKDSMNETSQPTTAEATVATATAPASGSETTTTAPLSTASRQWALKAAALDKNEDCYVATVDPLFDKQTKPVTFGEPVADEEDGQVTVRLSFEINAAITTDQGIEKAPGHRVNPFPRILKPATGAKAKEVEQADRDRATVARILEGLDLLPKAGGHKLSAIYQALGQLTGKQAFCSFSTVKGAKRDENGQFKTFQNYKFASVGSNGSASASPKSGGGDY